MPQPVLEQASRLATELGTTVNDAIVRLAQDGASARQRREPIAITAPTVMEIVRGLQATAATRPKMAAALQWFRTLVTSDLIEVLTLDRSAAILAGRLRALQPTPPTGARRKGTRPEQRAGWVLDIQIASCAWTHGREIATENRQNFEVLSELIATLYADVPPLTVTGPPAA